METNENYDYDYVIVGSGFGGSVSALRLSEKGYKVLVIEKGKWLGPNEFPKSNWQIRKWLWNPMLKMFGLFKMTFMRHVTIFSGVGVGGGSLVYANTLPVPKRPFFESPSWAHLGKWEKELSPFYKLAHFMLGASPNPRFFKGDQALQQLSVELNKEKDFEPTTVAVFFGEPNKTVPDPYFGGKGPERTGCHYCGACMIGCRFNSKNTLDKNYLYFAQKNGATIQAESHVYDVRPLGAADGADGYEVSWKRSTKYFGKKGKVTTKGIVFSGGVLGTIELLLKLKKKGSLPQLSNLVGEGIRTNSESLMGVVSHEREDLSRGVAIGSILNIDQDTHLELVRYPAGSGFFRTLMIPAVFSTNIFVRFFKIIGSYLRRPLSFFKAHIVPDFAKYSQVLLFMQTIDSTLRFKLGWFGNLSSSMSKGPRPTPFIPLAYELGDRIARILKGEKLTLITDSLTGIASTAHILGGATMGSNKGEGVIDANNHLFGYQNALVCDGSMISANIGVNPSLTITALSERAMAKIPPKAGRAPVPLGYKETGIVATVPKVLGLKGPVNSAGKAQSKSQAKSKTKAKAKAKAGGKARSKGKAKTSTKAKTKAGAKNGRKSKKTTARR